MQSPNFHLVSLSFSLQKSGMQGRVRYLMKIFFLIYLPTVSIAQTNFHTGEIFFKQEKFAQAKPIFEIHLTKHPKDKRTLEYLGDIAVHTKKWDDALHYYKELVQADETNAHYHYKYGGALGMKALSVNKLLASTYIGEIKRELELAAKLDPKHIETRWALIEYYLQLPRFLGGSERMALYYAKQLMSISTVDGYLANGHIAEHLNKYIEAEGFFKRAVEVGGSPHTYERLITLYEKNNQPEKALATATKSLKKHKDNQFNYQIGKIAAESNFQLQYGIERLNEYLINYSKNDKFPKAWAYYRMAQINKNIGDKKKALNWIDKALRDIPNFKEAKKERSLILAL